MNNIKMFKYDFELENTCFITSYIQAESKRYFLPLGFVLLMETVKWRTE